MKRDHKPIRKDLIRKCFGKGASVHGFAGHYRITTLGGGLVTTTPDNIRLVYGGEDVYRGVVLLAGAAGLSKARGSREFVLASIAHGEALGVNIQPDFRNRWATAARWIVAAFVYFIVFAMLAPDKPVSDDQVGICVLMAMAASGAVFFLMRRSAKREEQRKLETGGFIYPRQTQGADYADEETLRNGGLI